MVLTQRRKDRLEVPTHELSRYEPFLVSSFASLRLCVKKDDSEEMRLRPRASVWLRLRPAGYLRVQVRLAPPKYLFPDAASSGMVTVQELAA